jgi:iron complex outermembrane receptor protein
LKNRILWTFQTGDSFWHPENIGDVNSRGVESKISYAQKLSKFTYSLSFGGNLISSTALQDLDIPRIKAGEQLIYVPKAKVFGSLSLIYQRFLLSYRFLYNSSVNGVNEGIPSFKTGDVLVQYHLPIKHFGIKAYLNADNIWDESYRIIERRPMPGRNFSIGLTFSYVKTE